MWEHQENEHRQPQPTCIYTSVLFGCTEGGGETNPIKNIQPSHESLITSWSVCVCLLCYSIMVWTQEDAQLSLQTSQTAHILVSVKHHLSDVEHVCFYATPLHWQTLKSRHFLIQWGPLECSSYHLSTQLNKLWTPSTDVILITLQKQSISTCWLQKGKAGWRIPIMTNSTWTFKSGIKMTENGDLVVSSYRENGTCYSWSYIQYVSMFCLPGQSRSPQSHRRSYLGWAAARLPSASWSAPSNAWCSRLWPGDSPNERPTLSFQPDQVSLL